MGSSLKTYYWLAKPGIVYGNAITVTAGLFLAGKGHVGLALFLATLLGISLVMAGACVCNNYLDREIDTRMARTKKRALATGAISIRSALIYAAVLELIGFGCLIHCTNTLTVGIVAVGFVDYVILYGWAKRHSVHGTIVGSVAGAVPLVGGYEAVANHLGIEALLLFLIMALWQMPHFYAIAMYRLKDYKAAGIPVLPLQKGFRTTKMYILSYVTAFLIANLLLSWLGYTAYTYAIVMGLISLGWLGLGVKGFKALSDSRWARTMFLYSLGVVLVLSAMLSIGAIAP
jgi:heme o synthase